MPCKIFSIFLFFCQFHRAHCSGLFMSCQKIRHRSYAFTINNYIWIRKYKIVNIWAHFFCIFCAKIVTCCNTVITLCLYHMYMFIPSFLQSVIRIICRTIINDNNFFQLLISFYIIQKIQCRLTIIIY